MTLFSKGILLATNCSEEAELRRLQTEKQTIPPGTCRRISVGL